MALRSIRIFGACEHNLKNINLEIPRNSLTVITGLSGSGKSSLAFDTIYAEGQRRYIESLSAYARQFLDRLPKPHVEAIEGLSPAISIEQKTVSRNPRSTVATVTEIHDYLRLLYSTIGTAQCPHCGTPLVRQTADSILSAAAALPEGTRLVVLAPVIRGRKGEYQALFQKFLKEGFVKAKIDGEMVDLDPSMKLKKTLRHDISLVVDRLVVRPDSQGRLREAVATALRKAEKMVVLETVPSGEGEWPAGIPWRGEQMFSEEPGCPTHGPQIVDMAPRVFSFNSPYGWCGRCEGIGTIPEADERAVVPNPEKSLLGGAVAPWKYFFDNYDKLPQLLASSGPARLLFGVLDAIGVDVETPWKKLTAKQRDILLHGFRNAGEIPEAKGRGKKKVDFAEWTGVLGRILSRLEMTEDDEDYDELSRYLRQAPCPECGGARHRKESLAVRLGGANIAEVCRMDIGRALEFFRGLQFGARELAIAHQPLREITDRLQFLLNVGLHYLTLDRGAGSISGGEAQRIRLATQIGSRLRGVLYVLDEPSIGLHQRDNEKLIRSLCEMRDRGNTVLVVEHDEQTMRTADFLVDLGPGAGARGGQLVASGKPADVAASKESLTGRYLAGEHGIAVPAARRKPGAAKLTIEGARLHNLKGVRLEIPCGLLVGITGVSGSGKSSLIMETMLPILMNHCYLNSHWAAGPTTKVSGLEHFDRCIQMDQSPIGRTPRSNPATYTKLFDPIRDLFASTVDAKMRGYEKGRFSFNVKGGRCEECGGAGSVKVAMNFLPDVYVECTACGGRRYNQETLRVRYRGKSIADVLDMTVEEGVGFFEAVPTVQRVLQTLQDVGLGYIHLGQPATTFSGGEAQRIKLARELAKKNTGRSMYVLDEPTTGLHFADVQKLLDVANRLVDTGSTVVIIEHNLDVIKCCDWIVDMGPEGGAAGGEIVVEGTPEKVARCRESATGRFLAEALGAGFSAADYR